ncbi:MAG: hypothetical protein NVSMB66_7080 [Candidatus Doudnabacteria bacterium]
MPKMNKMKLASVAMILTLVSSTGFNFGILKAQADTMSAAPTGSVKIMLMTHLCNSKIKTSQDFEALETGRTPVAALANTVLNCPATGLVGDRPTARSVSSPRSTYDYSVTSSTSRTEYQSSDGSYKAGKLCETDLNVDANGDGKISPDVCLDVSNYTVVVPTVNGRVDVNEVVSPSGFHMGALRFTPSVVDGNNDKDSLISTDFANGIIKLDTTPDTDKMIMLHVYNFKVDSNLSKKALRKQDRSNFRTVNRRKVVGRQIRSLQAKIDQLSNSIK